MGPDVDVGAITPEELVVRYDDYVRALAMKLIRRLRIRIDPEDVIAYGYQGLLEAYERYDPVHGSQFSSFAYYRIRGAILDGCRKEGWLTRSRNGTPDRQLNEYLQTAHAINSSIPRPRSFGEAIDRVAGMVGEASTVVLLGTLDDDAVIDDDGPDEELIRRDLRRLLKRALKLLDDLEREIVILHYFKGMPMKEIGERFGHTKSWVSRIHTRSLARILEFMESSL